MPIKALLVEDNPADVRFIQELIHGAGPRQVLLEYADCLATAIRSLDSARPDVLLLDLALPDSRGLATFRRIHKLVPWLPIIVLTGLDDVEVAVEAIAEGAVDYLVKNDLSGGLLLRVLRYSLERQRTSEGLRHTERELIFKNQIANAFLTASSADMPAEVLRAMLEFMQSEKGVFGYIDASGALVCPATPDGGKLQASLSGNGGFARETWTDIWGRALAEKRPFLLNSPTREMGVAVTRVLAVPLLDASELIGLFEVADKPVDYDAGDRDFLERAAQYLAPMLHARLQKDAREQALADALAAKELLLQELHHRVKNNLQIICSLLNMEAEEPPPNARKALEESQRRVRSMALIHEQLYSQQRPDQLDFAEFASSLASELLAAYGGPSDRIRLRFDLEAVLLGIDQAMPCGLILNELLTNSFKYAFPGGRPGEILLGLRQDANRVTLRVADNGIGLPAGFDWRQRESLGLRIVDILTTQLNATVDCSSETGTAFAVTFERRSAPHRNSGAARPEPAADRPRSTTDAHAERPRHDS